MTVLKGLITTWPGRAMLGALVAVVVGGPMLIGRMTAPPPKVEVRTAAVQRGSVTQTVAVSGSVNPAATYKLTFKTTGRVGEIYVTVGQKVLAGAPLARLELSDLQIAVQQAQASLVSAQARYDQTVAGAAVEDVAQARQSVDNAARSLDTTRKTTESDLISSKLAYENAQRSLETTKRTALTDVANAQQTLSRLQSNYAAAKATFASLASSLRTDAAGLADALGLTRTRILGAIASIQRSTNQTADVVSARNDVTVAAGIIATAQSYAGAPLLGAIDEYAAARDALLAAISGFDAAMAQSIDPSQAGLGYQTTLTAYQAASSRLSTALDAPAGQLTSAQTKVTTAQNLLNTATTRIYADLDQARTDLANVLVSLVTLSQSDVALKGKITQANSTVATITDAVTGGGGLSGGLTGGLTNAQQALVTAQQKAETSLQSAQTALANAEQSFGSSQVKGDASISNAASSLESARLTLAKTTASPKAYDVAAAYATVLGAEVSLAKANDDLASATLRAPVAGTVATIAAQVGEQAPSGTTAFISFANTSSITLRGTVGEADVAKLTLGQVATISVDAVGIGTRMTGKVTSIDPVATLQQGVPVYGIDVTIDVPNPQVRPGMSGTASVIIANKTGVLVVQNLAVRNQAGRRYLQVQKNGETVDVDASFGIANDTLTEVLSGVQEGDLVVLPQPRAAASGQPRIGGPGGGVPVLR